MHELSVTQNILTVVVEAAQQAGAERVLAIHLVVGDLSSIVDESVQFYFDLLSRETLAAGAVLHFRRESATSTCSDCGHAFEATIPLQSQCPSCGSPRLHLSGGKAFYVESIEVNDENTNCERYSERE